MPLGLRSGFGVRVIEDIPRRDLFIYDPARDAEQRRHHENDRRDLEVVRPEIRAADGGGHDRRNTRDGRKDQELRYIDIRQARKIGHGILGRAGDQIKDEQQAVTLFPILQKPHGLQLVFKVKNFQDPRADPPRHEQNDHRTEDIPQQTERESAEPAPYQPGADLYRLRRYEFDHRL